MASKSTLTGLFLEELLLFITIFLLSLSFPSFSSSSRNNIGFTVPLIHSINSPRSPFYNPSLTRFERIQASVRNTYLRYHYMITSKSSIINDSNNHPDWIETPMSPLHNFAEYITSYQIGTPPVETFAVVDTASSLIWLQCLPCESCYKQKQPIFDPSNSSSYDKIRCDDRLCHESWLPPTWCNNEMTCRYGMLYKDNTSTEGVLATETLTFGYDLAPGTISLLSMIVGCGHKNDFGPGTSDLDSPPGVLGLNRGSLSFTSQLGIDYFSYCLLPIGTTPESETSKMHFGLAALIVGGKTPLISNHYDPDSYYLNLEGISVGNERLPIPAGTFNVTSEGNGGFIIDSGASFTLLNWIAYDLLVEDIKKKSGITEPGEDPEGRFGLCYWTYFVDLIKWTPNVTFHFTGVDLELSKQNLWVQLKRGFVWNGLWCLAMIRGTTAGHSVLANYQQRNINVGYDTHNNAISFQPMDCTKT
ncbi:Peptidase A1 [Macleaya cordata]|uniref:Peptidase A1 n=1 Tax=Macleaya cordata TaxID=56857 RepID=A0A200QNV3_MACCD|nr:Peptidase A1 [Macleaya cordata]